MLYVRNTSKQKDLEVSKLSKHQGNKNTKKARVDILTKQNEERRECFKWQTSVETRFININILNNMTYIFTVYPYTY